MISSSFSSSVQAMLSGSLSEQEVIAELEHMTLDHITVDDLIAAAAAVREHMIPVELDGDLFDTCGTGGSGLKTINTSTMTAFILAANDVLVAKHGNRSASGNCGCFDLLEALGAKIDLSVEQEQKVYQELGLVFLFAPLHHPSLRHVGPARKAFGKKTVFNLLGPLLSPARVQKQMIGTGTEEVANLLYLACEAQYTKACIVTGMDGLDEVTVCSDTLLMRTEGDHETISPEDFGLTVRSPNEIEGGTPEENVQIFKDIAAGGGSEAHRDLCILNAAVALQISGRCESIAEGVELTQQTLASGSVAKLIDDYVSLSQSV